MLGVTTETRAQMNYAGSRMAPWLGHTMVSRQEVPRPLLTPGEVMQLPPDDALVLVGGSPPLRAKKLRYFEEPAFQARLRPAAPTAHISGKGQPTDWDGLIAPPSSPQPYPSGRASSALPRVRSQRSPDPKQKSFEFSPLSPSADPPSPTPAPAPTPTQPADDALDAALGGPNDAVRVQFALDPDTLDSNL
jgi:type IV secretion system protein VirD4